MLNKDATLSRMGKMWRIKKGDQYYSVFEDLVDTCISLASRKIKVDEVALRSEIETLKRDLNNYIKEGLVYTSSVLQDVSNPTLVKRYMVESEGHILSRGAGRTLRDNLKDFDPVLYDLHCKARKTAQNHGRLLGLLEHVRAGELTVSYSPSSHNMGYIRSNTPSIVYKERVKHLVPATGKKFISVTVKYSPFYHVGNKLKDEKLLNLYKCSDYPVRAFIESIYCKDYAAVTNEESMNIKEVLYGIQRQSTDFSFVTPHTATVEHIKVLNTVHDYWVNDDKLHHFTSPLGREVENDDKPVTEYGICASDFDTMLLVTLGKHYSEDLAFISGGDIYLEVDEDYDINNLSSTLSNLSSNMSDIVGGWSRCKYMVTDIKNGHSMVIN